VAYGCATSDIVLKETQSAGRADRSVEDIVAITPGANLDLTKRLKGAESAKAKKGAVPKSCLRDRIRGLTDTRIAELEPATDEALGRVAPQG
jgi:hypothetical protein